MKHQMELSDSLKIAVIADPHLGTKWGTPREQDSFVQFREAIEKSIDKEINRGFVNQKRGEQLIAMGYKVKFFNGRWNLTMASGYQVCKLNATGTKRAALEEALQYVKVKQT